ncbi:MAG: hypothetical protein AAGD35_12055 [Actinomycetota bacterium]
MPADEQHDHTDLERLLGRGLEAADRPPDIAVEAAAALFDLIDADAVIASLVESASVALRSSEVEQRTFAWEGVELIIEIDRADGVVHLLGSLVGAEPATVEVTTDDATTVTAPCALGSFEVSVEAKAVRLAFVDAAARRLVTPWTVV